MSNGDMILKFTYDQDHPETRDPEDDDYSWWAENPYFEPRIGLCDSGLRQYVGIDDSTEEFNAVFSVDEPDCDHFWLRRDPETGLINLQTEKGVGWYEFVVDFLGEAHANGFRYLRVEFDG